jgi:GT2 family glycosyltransferase
MMLTHRFFGINRGQGEIDKGQYDTLTEPDYITGAAMLIKRKVFEKAGFFDKDLFIYYEDVDFCYRAKKIREWLRTPKTVYEFLITKDTARRTYSLLGVRDYYFRKFGQQTYW